MFVIAASQTVCSPLPKTATEGYRGKL